MKEKKIPLIKLNWLCFMMTLRQNLTEQSLFKHELTSLNLRPSKKQVERDEREKLSPFQFIEKKKNNMQFATES